MTSLNNRLEMVSREGYSFLVPATDKDLPKINSFKRWEVAFRVYAGIFTRANPSRATEIFQYTDAVCEATDNYVWDNVYTYDIIHRCFMVNNPLRSWSAIYLQAWGVRLRDPLTKSPVGYWTNSNGKSGRLGNVRGSSKEACWRFNKGKYSYGSNCRFEHK